MTAPEEDGWFEESFEAATQFMGILDPAGRILRANRAALEITGLGPAELANTPLWLIPWPALKAPDRRALQRAVRQAAGSPGAASRSKLELRRRGQPPRMLEFSIKPIRADSGELRILVVEGRDVTAYQRARAALFQSEARFQTIFEEAGIGIVIKGVTGRILDCNPAFEAMLGYTAAELRQRDYLEITHPLDKKAIRKLFNELVEGRRKNYFVEKRYLHRDGQVVWGSMAASLVRSQAGEPEFVISMVENITAQKQIAAELGELQQRLMHGREMERLRIAQDLHDGPLQAIIGVSYQVQELAASIPQSEGREQLQAMRTALQELARSLRAMCGELRPPTLAPFGLEPALRSHIQGFQAAHPELKVSSTLAHDGQSLPERTRIALFRIYQEALSNILRHAGAKTVKIRFRLGAKKAVLEIQDDGVGFELPDHWVGLARQGHLGLVGAIERAREVGGILEVSSAPGQGATLRASVPVEESSPQAGGEEHKL